MLTAPAARRRLAARASTAALLLAASACAAPGAEAGRPPGTAPAGPPSAVPSAPPAAPPVLTTAQARAALITDADLGEPWRPTRGAATWRDTLLKATADHPDCGRLLDALYTEDLFGTAPRATAALDGGEEAYAYAGEDDSGDAGDGAGEGEAGERDEDGSGVGDGGGAGDGSGAGDGAQLHYRIVSAPEAGLDRTLDWLGTLPGTCGRFTARGAKDAAREVRVEPAPVPEAGDARRGLRITVSAPAADAGAPDVLVVDLVAVRVGEDAISLTHGARGVPDEEATRTAVETGAERLTEIRRQGRAQV
ncbi:hypothetical protein VM636_14755 [Streptomyces sp. SCSIO 75703]|uniref:hypothetical protein n=1 Tax=Streptomyces sp. SCSIO 75703 TaxID=3112165 RepID=UPI0030D11F7B